MAQELPKVRLALPADEEPLMAMCRRLHIENGLFSFDEDKVRKVVQDAIRQRNLTAIGVIGPLGAIEGSICLLITEFYYTTDLHVAELWNFVDEPYRNSRNAAALIEHGRASARAANLPFFTGIITNKQMAGKTRLYRKQFGRPPVGAFFLDNSDWGFEPIADHADLTRRLRDFANQCTTNPRSITFDIAQKKVAPLLKEAAEAVSAEDNFWGPSKPNGSAVAAGKG